MVFLESMSMNGEAQSSNEPVTSGDSPAIPPIIVRDNATVKKEFETQFFKLKFPVRVAQLKGDDIRYLRQHEVRENEGLQTYEELTEQNGVKRVVERNFFERWWKDKDRRTYDRIIFLPPPLQCPDDVYNLFKGFRADSLPRNEEVVDIEPIMNLIRLTNERGKPAEAQVGV